MVRAAAVRAVVERVEASGRRGRGGRGLRRRHLGRVRTRSQPGDEGGAKRLGRHLRAVQPSEEAADEGSPRRRVERACDVAGRRMEEVRFVGIGRVDAQRRGVRVKDRIELTRQLSGLQPVAFSLRTVL